MQSPPVVASLAPFFGNLSVVTAPSTDILGLQRQATCSLTYLDFMIFENPSAMNATVKSQATSYEETIHNNAFLTTTPDLFTHGCADHIRGITSRSIVQVQIVSH
jgi:hypothetical protein